MGILIHPTCLLANWKGKRLKCVPSNFGRGMRSKIKLKIKNIYLHTLFKKSNTNKFKTNSGARFFERALESLWFCREAPAHLWATPPSLLDQIPAAVQLCPVVLPAGCCAGDVRWHSLPSGATRMGQGWKSYPLVFPCPSLCSKWGELFTNIAPHPQALNLWWTIWVERKILCSCTMIKSLESTILCTQCSSE